QNAVPYPFPAPKATLRGLATLGCPEGFRRDCVDHRNRAVHHACLEHGLLGWQWLARKSVSAGARKHAGGIPDSPGSPGACRLDIFFGAVDLYDTCLVPLLA